MNSYWTEVKDPVKFQMALNRTKSIYNDEMGFIRDQARVYQNFYNSCATSMTDSSEETNREYYNRKKFAYNITQVIIEALLNRIGKLRPKPSFISNNYLFSMKSKIKNLDTYVLSTFKKEKFFSKSETCLKNAYIQNTGIMKSFPMKDKIDFNVVDIENFYIYKPKEDSPYRNQAGDKTTTSLYEIYKNIYPKMDKKHQEMFIQKYNLESIDEYLEAGTFNDIKIEIFDFYKIEGKKGRRAVFTDKCVLVDEVWNYSFLPYDFCYYIKPQKGVIGISVSEILTPIQQRLNTLLNKISKSIDISMYPIILAHINSRVQKKINDKEGQVLTWEGGVPPSQFVQAVTHPQVFQHIDNIIDFAYRSLRMDERAIATSVPSGTNKASGVAIRNLENTEQSKHFLAGKNYEEFVVSISKKVAEYAVEENYNDIKDSVGDKEEFFKSINTWPVSIFPSTPEGKFQRAEFLIQAGLMSPEEIADLYDFPELAGTAISQKGAKISAIFHLIEKAIVEEENITPDPILGYDSQLEIAIGVYSKLLLEEDKYKKQILIMRDYIAQCTQILNAQRMQMMQEQMAMQAQAQGQAGAVPAPPEQSAISEEA